MNIGKNGVVTNKITEGLELMTLSDGSTWAKLYSFDYDISNAIWNLEEAKFCNKPGKYSCLGDLNKFIPADGWYEFYYTETRDYSKFIRWKQSYNPLSRYTSSSSGTSSEYQFISGTTSSSFYGLTRYTVDDTNNCYLRGYQSWWGAIAPYRTSYDVFPGMWGTSTGNHFQEIWIRITDNDNIAKTIVTVNNKQQSLYYIEK